MPAPLLYFSYGMTKCGSTLAFHLASVALQQAGYAQPKIPPPLIAKKLNINFVEHLSSEDIETLCDFANDLGHPLILKTHTLPDPAVKKILRSGRAIGCAAYRDPRDMALSMLDHGVRARKLGKVAFSEIATIDDAIDNIHHQTNRMAMWLKLPGIMPVSYNDIAFDSEKTITRIMRQLDITGDVVAIATIAKEKKFTQFNKGIPDRHILEMAEVDSMRIAKHFSPMFTELLDRPGDVYDGKRTVLRWYSRLNRGNALWTKIRNTFTFASETRKIT